MTSIVAPAIDAELEYRRERITKDFRSAQAKRKAPAARSRRTLKSKLTARTA
jgi:transposase